MKYQQRLIITICFLLFTSSAFAQAFPSPIKGYLDRNYRGWKLSQSRKDCNADVNLGFVTGDFNGDANRDYAMKFSKGKKGYLLAFLKTKTGFKPFVLHNYTAGDTQYSSLGVWKKGETFEYSGKKLRLKHDAPFDYRCESDVGGIHYYQNGKFVGY